MTAGWGFIDFSVMARGCWLGQTLPGSLPVSHGERREEHSMH